MPNVIRSVSPSPLSSRPHFRRRPDLLLSPEMHHKRNRAAPLAITLFGLVTNFAVAVQIIAAWRSVRWGPDADWETDAASTVWKGVDGVKLVLGMLSVYFVSSAVVCFIGLRGILKGKAAHVRFYRDYSIADFTLSAVTALLTAYAALHASIRTRVCEELSRQPDLMRDFVDVGLSSENCEQWFERAVLASLAIIIILLVIRLHFLLAVSSYYSQLTRSLRSGLPFSRSHHSHSRHRSQDALQRIYLLPRTSASQPSGSDTSDEVVVYQPVLLSTLPSDLRSSATEAWISRVENEPRRQPRIVPGSGTTGRIVLPIVPDEPLLPSYQDIKA